MRRRLLIALILASATALAFAEEGMWRIDQLPRDLIAKKYGATLTDADISRLKFAPVRLLSGGGGGTGTFASAAGLILTNHHVALDCIRTSTLAEQGKGKADNLIEQGFTAGSMAEELPCRRFQAQIERSAVDVTARLNEKVTPGLPIAEVQRIRQANRSDMERTCEKEKGAGFSCAVTDFNSGARSFLIVYEVFKDLRLVYAPEKQLGYYGGDEMNFRFPRYVSDISILRAYVGKDGSRTEFDAAHVPYRPEHVLKVTMAGVKEGDLTLVAGNPGNTNRYRESYSANYNITKGFPDRIRDEELELSILRKHAKEPKHQVLLQERIFGLANTLKYEQDVFASMRASTIVADWQKREREFQAFLETKPELKAEFGDVLKAQAEVYAKDVESNADLDAALTWLQKSTTLGHAIGLHEFALARSQKSDATREPQFQERFWPDIKEALLVDEPVIPALEEDLLAVAFEKALALPADRRIPAVTALAEKAGGSAKAEDRGRKMAQSILAGSTIAGLEVRKALVGAELSAFTASKDVAIVLARALEPSLADQRQRLRVLNEKLLGNRARFARGLFAWKGADLYFDANFTLRATFGQVAGYQDETGRQTPFTTRLTDMFALARSKDDRGDYALPAKLKAWRTKVGDKVFADKYAQLPVNFVSTNDITGGNSGSATLNKSLEIVGLIFDGNREGMAGDWVYNASAGRALSTDIRFALMVAREVHGAGWVVDELLK